MSGRTCRGRQAGALRKRLLAGQIIFKAFFPMDQAGQTCDDDFGRTEFVKPLTKLRKLRFRSRLSRVYPSKGMLP